MEKKKKETEQERVNRLNKHLVEFHKEFGKAKDRVLNKED